MSSFFVSVSLPVTTCTHTIRWWLPTCLCRGRRRWAPRCSARCSNTTTAAECWAMTSHPWVSNVIPTLIHTHIDPTHSTKGDEWKTIYIICIHGIVMLNYKHIPFYRTNVEIGFALHTCSPFYICIYIADFIPSEKEFLSTFEQC